VSEGPNREEIEREFDADAGAALSLSANEVKEADSEWNVTRTRMEESRTATQWGGLARSAIDILLRAAKLRYGAVGPGVCAQALSFVLEWMRSSVSPLQGLVQRLALPQSRRLRQSVGDGVS
jgi:hypothetical protein